MWLKWLCRQMTQADIYNIMIHLILILLLLGSSTLWRGASELLFGNDTTKGIYNMWDFYSPWDDRL